MSNPMQRIVSRPFGGRNVTPNPSQPPAQADPPPQMDSVTDYMINENDGLRDHWVNPHVAAFHSQRAAPRPAGLQRHSSQPGNLRLATPEQRAAYVAQRDAENAAASGSDSHPPASPVPPTPTIPAKYRTSSLAAPPGKGAAQRRPSPDEMPHTPTPYNSSDPEATGAARVPVVRTQQVVTHQTAVLEQPMDRLPTPPPPPSPPAAQLAPVPTTPLRQSVATALSDALGSPIHMVPPSRRRSAVPARSDIEVEVRGQGADRVVTIRFLSAGPSAQGGSSGASGATATR